MDKVPKIPTSTLYSPVETPRILASIYPDQNPNENHHYNSNPNSNFNFHLITPDLFPSKRYISTPALFSPLTNISSQNPSFVIRHSSVIPSQLYTVPSTTPTLTPKPLIGQKGLRRIKNLCVFPKYIRKRKDY
jgi:hypothetical protein